MKEKRIKKEELILQLAQSLSQAVDHSQEEKVKMGLGLLGDYFQANRVFLFFYDPNQQTFSLAHEWFAGNDYSLKDSLQLLSCRDYKIWGHFEHRKSCFGIPNTGNLPDSYPFDSKLFQDTHTRVFMQKLLSFDGHKLGFIAVSGQNPEISWDDESVLLLDSCGEILKSLIADLAFRHSREQVDNDQKKSSEILFKTGQEDIVEKLEVLLNDLQCGIAVVDLADQAIVFMNTRCRDLFGIANQKLPELEHLFKVFKANGYNSHDFFSMASHGKVKDFTLNHIDRCLNGTVIPSKKGMQVVVSVNDITPLANYEKAEKSFNARLKLISETAIELISQHADAQKLNQLIGDTAFKLVNNSIIFLSRFNPDGSYLETVYVKGISYPMEVLAKFIGKHPMEMKYPVRRDSENYNVMISSRVKELKNGIAELSLGEISESVAVKIEKQLGVSKIFVCGLFTENELYGTIAFLCRQGAEINHYILETYARTVSNALSIIEMGNTLGKTSLMLSEALKIAKVGYWEFDFKSRKLTLTRKLYQILEPELAKNTTGDYFYLDLDEVLAKYVSKKNDVSFIRETVSQLAKAGKDDNKIITHEFQIESSAGETYYIFVRGVLQNDHKIVGMAQNITETKRVEKKLWESELKFQGLVEQSMDSIVVVKDDGVVIEWNSSAEKITGIKSSDAIGLFAWQVESELLFNPELNKHHPQQLPEKLKNRFFSFFNSGFSGSPQQSEITIRNRNNEVRHLLVSSFIFNAGNNRFLCRISKDITLEREKLEQEKQNEIRQRTAKAKDLFLDNMSHEMRTPLGGIIGMTDLLLNTELSEQQIDMLNVVKESSDTLLELISNINDLSRLEADGVVLRKAPFSISLLLERLVAIFRAVSVQKGVEIRYVNNTPAGYLFVGDEFRLRQLLGNLLGNAVKFTPPGGEAEIRADLLKQEDGTADLEFRVTDTGIGIPKERIPGLFEKFSQIDDSYTREYDGAGIGLFICQELVKLMEGEIEVTSEMGKGSLFKVRVRMPLQKDE